MKIAAVVSTRGGPGKTTVGANLGAFCADAGLRTLLIDLDNQPSLSSFYALSHEATGGTYQLIANNETRFDQIISQTCIPNLSLIHSNDPFNQLSNLLLHAADGRLRLKNLLPAFERDFDRHPGCPLHCLGDGTAGRAYGYLSRHARHVDRTGVSSRDASALP